MGERVSTKRDSYSKQPSMQPRFLNERQVTELTGKALSTLRNDRWNGRGIPYCKDGRRIFYDYEDVLRYMEARKIHVGASC